MSRAFIWIALLLAGCAAFPANEAGQLALRDRNDEAGMRHHGWALLARVAGTGLEGWHGLGETFRWFADRHTTAAGGGAAHGAGAGSGRAGA